MTDKEMAEKYASDYGDDNILDFGDFQINLFPLRQWSFFDGLKAGKPQWHEYSERPKEKINALCFDIEQNKFILGFYDLEADEWLRYGGYETINIDLWTKIEIPEFIKE